MTTKTTTKAKPRLPEGRLFFRIGEVARIVGVKPYVLRYWESEFPSVAPKKGSSGHRVYGRAEVERLLAVRKLLHEERYSIEGARKKLKEAVSGRAPSPALSVEQRRGLLRELEASLSRPVSEFFRYSAPEE
jgi:DNA-binding transcriptional MerR regulator